MAFVSVLLLVVFVIICILIVALVLLQNEEGDGLGGLLSMGSHSAFGSRSANVLTKTTYVLVTLFFITAFFLAFIHKSPSDKGLEDAARKEQSIESSQWWIEDSAEDVESNIEDPVSVSE